MDCILFIWFLDSGKYKLEQIVAERMIRYADYFCSYSCPGMSRVK